MTTRLSVSKRALVVESGAPIFEGTVDILIDGRRIWSVQPPEPDEKGRIRLAWPKALQPYLNGRAEITLRSSATGELLAQKAVRLGTASRQVEVCDAQGRWLAMNKWDRLGPSFEGNESGVQGRLLASAQLLVTDLQKLGYPVFIVGGTLLGAKRSGTLLPHDDDIDLAWICRESNPMDIALASMRMERELVARGYTSIRLSYAHLQITFFSDHGDTDHYVDVFTGFFMDGEYGQPFALRGNLERSSLEPIGSIALNGVNFPAPARPEAWLEFAYGPNWRVPDPSFVFDTAPSTQRRFETWFGVFNRGRVFWEKHFEKLTTRPQSDEGHEETARFLDLLPAGAAVVDMGSSDGRLTERIAGAGHKVVGVDFSYESLRLARIDAPAGIEYKYMNFNDRRMLLDFGLDLLGSSQPWYFCANHLLAGVPHAGRGNVFLFLRMMLSESTFAYATIDTNFSRNYQRERPDSWHLPLVWLRDEAAAFALKVEVVHTGHRLSPIGRRATSTVLIRRDPKRKIQIEVSE